MKYDKVRQRLSALLQLLEDERPSHAKSIEERVELEVQLYALGTAMAKSLVDILDTTDKWDGLNSIYSDQPGGLVASCRVDIHGIIERNFKK